MRDIPKILHEIAEYIYENKNYWLIPTILAIVILWLLISTAGNSSVPVFIYPLV